MSTLRQRLKKKSVYEVPVQLPTALSPILAIALNVTTAVDTPFDQGDCNWEKVLYSLFWIR